MQFQDWPLTLAAYNTGEDRVHGMLQRFRAHDFWTLSGQFAAPNETRRYVPAVLANIGISALGLRAPSGPTIESDQSLSLPQDVVTARETVGLLGVQLCATMVAPRPCPRGTSSECRWLSPIHRTAGASDTI